MATEFIGCDPAGTGIDTGVIHRAPLEKVNTELRARVDDLEEDIRVLLEDRAAQSVFLTGALDDCETLRKANVELKAKLKLRPDGGRC